MKIRATAVAATVLLAFSACSNDHGLTLASDTLTQPLTSNSMGSATSTPTDGGPDTDSEPTTADVTATAMDTSTTAGSADTTNPNPDTTNPNPDTTTPDPDTTNPNPDTTNPNPDTTDPDTTDPDPDTTDPDPDTTDGDSSSTGDVCTIGTIVCDGNTSKTCDGDGGFMNVEMCPDICTDGVGCELLCSSTLAVCEASPRIMVLLDASSSMLSLQNGALRAKEGQGGWEEARDVLAGPAGSLFDVDVGPGSLGSRAYLGLAVFGLEIPDESDVLVPFGTCVQPNFAWALDPESSCDAPGCSDPYADAPITWTFHDGMSQAPFFDHPTYSHMPRCDKGNAPNKGCYGSTAYVHLGLIRVRNEIMVYKEDCMNDPVDPCDANTEFVNIIILDGTTPSMAGQYGPPLQQMTAMGIKTYVIGFGPGADSAAAITTMNDIAAKGGTGTYHNADTKAQLAAALATIVGQLDYPGC